MTELPPEPAEVTEFLYKLQGRLKVFSAQGQNQPHAASMVAAASKYGLLFVATPTGFQVIMTSTLGALPMSQREDVSSYPRRDVILNTWPTHVAVNCDQTRLAAVVISDSCPFAILYDVASFTTKNIVQIHTARLCATPGTTVNDLAWNPAVANTLAACLSDGSVIVYDFACNSLHTLPPTSKSTCLCWSPKGKQIVIGSGEGTLSQYKPDLQLVKSLQPPPPPQSCQGAAAVVNVYWVSNYQFAAVYSFGGQAALMIVNAPKGVSVKYINYDDICFSGGTVRNPQFYLYLQTTWNVLIVASANSIEVGTLGSADQVNWVQWTQEDSARAELPLTSDHQETYPLGIAFDTSNIRQYPWGENQFLPPPPLLAMLSNDGLLCLFNVINLRPGAPTLCTPPTPPPDMSGLDEFTVPDSPPPQPQRQPQQQQQPQLQQQLPQSQHQQPQVQQQPPQSQLQQQQSQLQQQLQMQSPQQQQSQAQFQQQQQTQFSSQTQAPKPTIRSTQPLFQQNSPQAAATAKTVHWADEQKGQQTPQSSFAPQATSGLVGWGQSSTPVKPDSSGGLISGAALATSAAAATPPAVASPISSSPAHQSSPLSMPVKPLPSLVSVPPAKDGPLQKTVTAVAPAPKTEQSKSTEPGGMGDSPAAIDPAVYNELISEEIVTFTADLKKKQRTEADFKKVGTQEERKILCTGVSELEEFLEGRMEHVATLKSEVVHLKAVAFEALRWMEDARSRLRKHNDPSYLHLMKAADLDSTTARHADNISYLLRYVESQIRDADNQLGAQWGEFQDGLKARSNKMQVPLMEGVYQTLVRQKNILNKLRGVLEDVDNRLRQRRRRQTTRGQLINNAALKRVTNGTGIAGEKSSSDLSKLAENLLHMKLNQSNSNDFDASLNNNGSSDIERLTSIKLSKVKEAKLRKVLEQQPMVRVKPNRTYTDMQVVGMRASCSFGSTVLHLPSPRSKKESSSTPSISNKLKPLSSSPKAQPQEIVEKPTAASTPTAPTTVTTTSTAAKPAFSLPPGTTIVSKPTKEPERMKPTEPSVPIHRPTTPPLPTKTVQPTAELKLNSKDKELVAKPPEEKPKTTVRSSPVNSSDTFTLFGQKPATPNNMFGGALAASTATSPPSQVAVPKFSTQSLLDSSTFTVGTKPFQTPLPAKPTETPSLFTSPFSQIATSTTASKDEPVKTSTATPFSFVLPKPETSASLPKSESPLFFGSSTTTSIFGGSKPLTSSPGGFFQSAADGKLGSGIAAKSPVDSLGSLVASLDSTVGKASVAEKATPAVSIFPVPSTAPSVSAAASFSFTLPSITTVTTSTVPTGPVIVVNPAAAKAPLNLSTNVPKVFGEISITPVGTKENASATAVATAPVSTSSAADSTTSMFGSFSLETTPSTKPGSVFGGKPFSPPSSLGSAASEAVSSASQPQSFFGGSTTTDSQPKTIFGAPNTSTASSFSFSPLFSGTPASSAPATSAQAASPVFGETSLAASTSTTSTFVPATTPTFAPATTTTFVPATTSTFIPATTSTFAPATTSTFAPATTSTFAPATTSTFAPATTSTFAPATTSTFAPAMTSTFAPTTTSPFGSSAPSGSIFGQATSTSAFGGSSFSFATTQSQAPKTGAESTFTFSLSALSTPTTTQSLFGAKPATPFGTTTPATTSQTTFMGQPVCSPSAFGAGAGTAVGATSPAAGAATNVFGGGKTTFGTVASPTLFGATPTPAFGQTAFGQSSGSGFGTSGGSIFGGAAATSTANSVFGGSSTGNLFQSAANTTSSNIFGGSSSGGGAFSSGGGAFSSGVGVGQTGFGAPSTPRAGSGFGAAPTFGSPSAAPAFGSPPAFGSSPTFGSPPAFGAAPTFGSPGRVFGQSPSAAPTFGSSSPQQNSTFETLATQDSGITFGNLAQATSQQTPNLFSAAAATPAFSSANTSFGGSSFSSWR